MRKYVETIWLPRNISADTGLVSEMRTVAQTLDSLLESPSASGDPKLLQSGDIQMQRLKALERFHKDRHWGIAGKMLLTNEDGVQLCSTEEIAAVQKAQLFQSKLKSNEEKLAGMGLPANH